MEEAGDGLRGRDQAGEGGDTRLVAWGEGEGAGVMRAAVSYTATHYGSRHAKHRHTPPE